MPRLTDHGGFIEPALRRGNSTDADGEGEKGCRQANDEMGQQEWVHNPPAQGTRPPRVSEKACGLPRVNLTLGDCSDKDARDATS